MKNNSIKKKGTFIFGAFLSLAALVGCNTSADTDPSGNEEQTHEHVFSTEWSKDSTNHWHAATCEHTSEKSNSAAHTFGEWSEKSAPTYDAAGVDHRTCSVCDYEETREGAAKLNHNYATEWSSDASKHWHACTDAGYANLKKDEANHVAGEWEVTKEATVSEKGSKQKKCTVCNAIVATEEIPMLDHNYASTWSSDANKHWHACTDAGYTNLKKDEANHVPGEWNITKEATFTEKGSKEKKCTVCNAVVATEEIPEKAHNYATEWTSNETNHWHACTDAGYTDLKSNDAAHTAGDWEVTKEATFTETGSKQKSCTVCNKVLETEVIAVKEHSYSDSWSSDETNHWHACTDAGFPDLKKDVTPHVWGEGVVTQEATCTEKGVKTFTCECGKTKTEDIAAKGHDFSDDSLVCKNGCGNFKALYNGTYYDITEEDRVGFTKNPDYDSGRKYTTDAAEKANIAQSALNNPLTFVVHATGGSDKTAATFNEIGDNYSIKLTTAGKIFQSFTRFSYKPDFKGTLLVSFEMSVDQIVDSVTGVGLYVQDTTFTNVSNRSSLVGANAPFQMVPNKTYRFVYRVELKDHSNETLAIAANKLTPASDVLPTLTVSNLRMKEISTVEPENPSCYLLSFTEDAPLAMADCTHLTKQTVENTATCSQEGILAHETCLTCGKNLIDDVVVDSVVGKLPHDKGEEPVWQKDETGHWHVCKDCNEVLDFTAHTPDPEKTPGVDDIYCTVCNYKISDGADPHTHVYEKVDAVPTCAPEGGHEEYYKCSCGECSKDENGDVIISEPESIRDVLHSNHTYVDKVCSVCGAKDISVDVVDLGADSTDHNNKNDQVKTSGSGNNATYTVDHPGVWSIQANGNGAKLDPENNRIFASTATATSAASKNCFVRIIPNEDIKTNGGTFFASFDLTPADNQVGIFQLGISTSNAENVSTIATAGLPEATIGETYHVEVLVTLDAGAYFQMSFKNGANGNTKVWIENINLVQMAEADIPEEAVSGVVKVSWPWAE